jgi:hypothetical protein
MDPANVHIALFSPFAAGSWDNSSPNTFTATNNNDDFCDTTTIHSSLNAGTSVVVLTTPAVGGAGNITVESAIQPSIMSNGGGPTLTLTAENNITVNSGAPMSPAQGSFSVVLNAKGSVILNDSITTGGGNFTVSTDTDQNGSGTFTVAAGKTVTTNNGSVSITTRDIDLQGSINAGTGDVTIVTVGAQTIGLGATAGSLTISGAELQRVTCRNLTIGNASTPSIDVDGITAANSANISGTVTLNSNLTGVGNGIVNFVNTTSSFGALTVVSWDLIRVNVPISITNGDASFTTTTGRAQGIIFTPTTNAITNTKAGGNITLVSNGALTGIGDLTASNGTISIRAPSNILSAAIVYCGTGPTGRIITHFFSERAMRDTISTANRL